MLTFLVLIRSIFLPFLDNGLRNEVSARILSKTAEEKEMYVCKEYFTLHIKIYN